MNRMRTRLLIGLVVAVALAWGATLDLTAAKAAAKATATATATAAANPTPTATAKPARRATATRAAVLPSEPFPNTLAAAVAPQGKTKATKPAGKPTRDQVYVDKFKQDRAVRAEGGSAGRAAKGLKPGIAGLAAQAGWDQHAAVADPGGVPHYFGPYGNWAFSPLPEGPIATVTVVDGGTGYTAPMVTVDDAYLPATASPPATVTATVDATTGAITGFSVVSGGAGYMAPVVTITDDRSAEPCSRPAAPAPSATRSSAARSPAAFASSWTRLPGLTPAGANNLGQYIPVGVPEPCTYSGQAADCYSIALVEYTEKMHSDLPATKLRGYVQLSTAAVPGAHDRAPRSHDARRHPGVWRGQPPLPRARHRGPGQGSRPWDAGGRREAGSHHVLQPASKQCRRRKPLPAGGRDGSGFRDRTRAAGRGRRQVHAEPGDHPPPRQQHRVDQRRQHPPVDHAGK